MDADFWEKMNPSFLSSEDIKQMHKPVTDDPYPAVPSELKALPQWVLWKSEVRKGKQTKIPKQVSTGANASSSNPSTWATYQDVLIAEQTGMFDGIGFVFTERDPYIGIDLDNCIRDGELLSWTQEIIDRFKSIAYCEVSPSGNGIKIWTRAELPTIAKHKVYIDKRTGEAIESYDSARYFTVTGLGKHEIGEGQASVDWLVAKYLKKETPAAKPPGKKPVPAIDTRDTAEIQRLIDDSRQRGKYHALMQGNWQGQGYGSHSEGDIGLISLLCFWTQDSRKLDTIFRQSGLYRDKWDVKHRGDGATYGEMTIEKALSQGRETYAPSKKKNRRRRSEGFYEARSKRRKYGNKR